MEQRILRASTARLVSYPRVEPSGAWMRKQPVSCTVRIGTPAVSMPSASQSARVDLAQWTTDANAAEGATSIGVTAVPVELPIVNDHASTSNADFFALGQCATGLLLDGSYSIEFRALGSNGASNSVDITVTLTLNLVDGADDGSGVSSQIVNSSSGDGANWSATASYDPVLGACLAVYSSDSGGNVTWTINATPTLTAGAFARGRRYLLEGSPVLADVVADQSDGVSSTLHLAEPLPQSLASGATVKGWACSVDLTAAQTDQVGNATALWTATFADGSSVTWSQVFRVVRRIVSSALTPPRLTQAWPVIRTLRSRQDASLEEIIQAAWEHRIVPWLEANGVDEEDLLEPGVLEPLHAVGCVLQLVEANASISSDVVSRVQARWDRLTETTLARKGWFEAQQDTDPTNRPEDPDESRGGFIRLGR